MLQGGRAFPGLHSNLMGQGIEEYLTLGLADNYFFKGSFSNLALFLETVMSNV